MAKDLRLFLERARHAGGFYVEVKRPLKPELEVGIIHQKLSKDRKYPVIYCPEIEGSKLPLVTEPFGSHQMVALIFDMDPRVERPKILQEYIKRLNQPIPPQMVSASGAPVKEVILRGKDADLRLLPILKHAELDSGKYMTLNPLICRDPITGLSNVGVYRHELKAKNELSVLMIPGHHHGAIAQRHAELGKLMEVVIFSGHHPAAILGAIQPGPFGQDELQVLGGFLGEPLRITPAETVDLPVPADAEIVIEGVIDPAEAVTDGPFAEFLGYYGEVAPCKRIRVNCITMRRDAIYLDLDTAHREQPTLMTLPAAAATYTTVKNVVPDIKDVHYPVSGRIHHAYLSIKQTAPGEAKRAALAALASMKQLTLVVVVDEDIDIYDDEDVLWAISTRVRADQDIDIIPGVAGGTGLDPIGVYDQSLQNNPRGSMSTKVIIDATKPVGLPFPTRVTTPKALWDTIKLEDYLK